MSNASSPLLWEVVKNFNSHMRKSAVGGGSRFSAEAGNVSNLSTYKHSALIQGKSVTVTEVEGKLAVGKWRGKAAHQPKKSKAVTVIKKNPRRSLKSVAADISSYRPDLKKAAVARASAVLKAQRSKSSSAKAAK